MKGTVLWTIGALVAASAFAPGSRAFAQEDEEEGRVLETPEVTPVDPAEAKARAAEILNEGNGFFEQKKYGTALSKYESAYRVYASPKILFNIAEAHRELGHVGEAITNYERFLNEANIEPGSSLHQKVSARLEELKAAAGLLAIDSPVKGAEVKVDGRSVGKTPFEHPVTVGGGVHEVTANMPGYQPYRENVEVGVGKTASVKLDLVPGGSGGGDPRKERADVTAQTSAGEEQDLTSKWWFWTAIGGAAVVGTVVIIAIASSGHGNDFVPMGALGSSSTSTWTKF